LKLCSLRKFSPQRIFRRCFCLDAQRKLLYHIGKYTDNETGLWAVPRLLLSGLHQCEGTLRPVSLFFNGS
jgi:hypothetical protein